MCVCYLVFVNSITKVYTFYLFFNKIILLPSGHKTHLATDTVAHPQGEREKREGGRKSNNKRGFFQVLCRPVAVVLLLVVVFVRLVLSFKVQNKKQMRRVVLPCELLRNNIRKFSRIS